MAYAKQNPTTSGTITQALLRTMETQYDEAIEQGLILDTWAPVDLEEPEQVDSTFGPCIEFADAVTQSIRRCYRWPSWTANQGLAMEIQAAADTSFAGNFRVRIGYRINGGSETTADQSITTLASTTAIVTVDLGTIIASGGLAAGNLVTLRISRLGADAADTHTGTLRIYHARLKKV